MRIRICCKYISVALVSCSFQALAADAPAPANKSDDAQVCSGVGVANYVDQTLEELIHTGPVNLEKVIVKGQTNIHGPLEARNCQFSDLHAIGPVTIVTGVVKNAEIIGPAKFTQVKMGGDLTVTGPIQAKSCHLKRVKLNARYNSLYDAKAQSVYIRQDKSDSSPQVLTLLGDTHVEGTIHFESGNGVVKIYGSHVQVGAVQGGYVQRMG